MKIIIPDEYACPPEDGWFAYLKHKDIKSLLFYIDRLVDLAMTSRTQSKVFKEKIREEIFFRWCQNLALTIPDLPIGIPKDW